MRDFFRDKVELWITVFQMNCGGLAPAGITGFAVKASAQRKPRGGALFCPQLSLRSAHIAVPRNYPKCDDALGFGIAKKQTRLSVYLSLSDRRGLSIALALSVSLLPSAVFGACRMDEPCHEVFPGVEPFQPLTTMSVENAEL